MLFALLGDATGSSRALRQLRALRGAGLAVTLLGFGPMRDAAALPEGVAVRLLPLPRGRGPTFFLAADRALRRATRALPARLCLASDLYVLPALAAAARRHGARLVYDARELYAALDATAGRPLVGRAWDALEHAFAHRADAVLTVCDSIADRLAARHGIARPHVFYNAPDHTAAPPRTDALRARLGLDARPIVLYQGLFRQGRGLPALLRAAAGVPDVQLVLVGEGALEADLRARAAPLGNRVRFLPFTPPDALAPLTASADVGAVLIEGRTESLRLSLPNKLFEYLVAGVPVLASPLPEISRVVETFGAGLVADPDDPEALARALARLATDTALRTRLAAAAPAAAAAHSWAAAAPRFQRLIASLLDPA